MANIPTTTTTTSHRRQKRMGPAPFASFEDLSDEVRSGTDTATSPTTRLPGIHEDVTPSSTTLTPSAPRIDISRASSSSHHEDSRDSTPERELFQSGNEQCKLGLAFKEEGALELRSSTEELDFQDPSEQKQQRTSSVTVVMAATSCELPLTHHRKDSQGSEYGGLLSISGRTSRLSSIGSQGSRVSGQSRLSVTSEMSRSPSPHKMLLETSFCGSKHEVGHQSTDPPASSQTKIIETELLERVLLSRKHDPTEAILAEGISIECRRKLKPADSLVQLSPVLQHHDEIERSPVPPEKPARKSLTPKVSSNTAPTNVTITVDKPVEDVVENDTRCIGLKPGELVVAESGTEYTFIPLKGPLPKKITSNTSGGSKGASPRVNKQPRSGEPQYIRIKLKPDHMYPGDQGEAPEVVEVAECCTKPVTLELNGSASHGRSPRSSPSPSVSRKSSFASLFRAKDYGTSPESPTTVRIPPLVKCIKTSPRSRSKSSDREHRGADTAKNNKSMFTLFKTKKSHSKSKQSLNATDQSPNKQITTTSLHSLEFTFDRPTTTTSTSTSKKRYEIPLDADTIIIPLHSPGNEPPPLPLYAETPTTEEQILPETTKPTAAAATCVVDSPSTTTKTMIEKNVKTSNRQSSTSSENVVFTTNLGSDNEVFTTKLPKKRTTDKSPIERGRQRDRPPPPPVPPTTLPVVVTSITSTVTTMTSSSPVVQMRSPCTSVNAKISEIITEKGMTSAKVSKTTSPVARKAEKLIISGDQDNTTTTAGDDSSESETDFPAAAKPLELLLKKQPPPQMEESENEVERKGLVLQTDSFDDELPYVPTTLPLERSVAIPIVPVKQRATFEMKTCPIERPRSTTPINPSCLEEYVEDTSTERAVLSEKLRICLPREDSIPGAAATSVGGLDNRIKEREKGAKKWTDFVPQHHHHHHYQQQIEEEPAPPLPPRGFPKDWINFEDIPERRKPPKRIQTIPSRGALIPPTTPSTANIDDGNVIYSYVNPEDCKCECHESTTGKSGTPTTPKIPTETTGEDEQPLLLLLERRSDDDSSPDSQTGAGVGPPPPPIKKKTKPTNAFPKVATTKPS